MHARDNPARLAGQHGATDYPGVKSELRDTGIDVVGNVPWGTHFTLLYDTRQDLIDVIVPYLAAGLRDNELCEWMPSDPESESDVRRALRAAVPDFDERAARGQVEFNSAREFYIPDGHLLVGRLMAKWEQKRASLKEKGLAGMRVTCDSRWLETSDLPSFLAYEKALHAFLRRTRMLVLCTYPLANRTASDVFDIANEHHFAIARRHGAWDVLETTRASQPGKIGSGRGRPTAAGSTARPERTGIMIVDDHPVVRAGLRAILEDQRDLHVVAEATNGAEAVQQYKKTLPDVVLMDLRLPVLDGVEAIRAIREVNPQAQIVALTTFLGDADVYRAVEAGASGYVLKDTLGENLVRAVRTVATGQRFIPPDIANRLAQFVAAPTLTPREREVLELAAQGLRNRDIAKRIGRTEATVKVHLKHVMEKLGVRDRTSAVTVALQRGLVHLPQQ